MSLLHKPLCVISTLIVLRKNNFVWNKYADFLWQITSRNSNHIFLQNDKINQSTSHNKTKTCARFCAKLNLIYQKIFLMESLRVTHFRLKNHELRYNYYVCSENLLMFFFNCNDFFNVRQTVLPAVFSHNSWLAFPNVI